MGAQQTVVIQSRGASEVNLIPLNGTAKLISTLTQSAWITVPERVCQVKGFPWVSCVRVVLVCVVACFVESLSCCFVSGAIDSIWSSSRREVAIVLFCGDRSQNIPSQGTSCSTAGDSVSLWQMLIYLVRIPRCQDTLYNATCQLAVAISINGDPRVASDMRDLNLPKADWIEQPLPNFVRWLLFDDHP